MSATAGTSHVPDHSETELLSEIPMILVPVAGTPGVERSTVGSAAAADDWTKTDNDPRIQVKKRQKVTKSCSRCIRSRYRLVIIMS